MTGKKKKKGKSLFDSIRKPVAPPSRKIGKSKPDEKVMPSQRKLKHKKQDQTES